MVLVYYKCLVDVDLDVIEEELASMKLEECIGLNLYKI